MIKKHQLRRDLKFGAMILIKSCHTDTSYKKKNLCYCDHRILYCADHKMLFLKNRSLVAITIQCHHSAEVLQNNQFVLTDAVDK